MRMVRKRPHQASPSRMSQTQKMLFSGRHALIFHILSEYFMRHCKLTEISIFQINILGTHSRWMMLKPSPSSCTLLQSSFRKCTPPFGSHNMMPMFPHLVTSCFMQSLHFRSHLFLDFRSFPITNKNFLLQSCRMTDFACFDDISTSYNRLYRIVTHFLLILLLASFLIFPCTSSMILLSANVSKRIFKICFAASSPVEFKVYPVCRNASIKSLHGTVKTTRRCLWSSFTWGWIGGTAGWTSRCSKSNRHSWSFFIWTATSLLSSGFSERSNE